MPNEIILQDLVILAKLGNWRMWTERITVSKTPVVIDMKVLFWFQRNIQIGQLIDGLGCGYDHAVVGMDMNDSPLSKLPLNRLMAFRVKGAWEKLPKRMGYLFYYHWRVSLSVFKLIYDVFSNFTFVIDLWPKRPILFYCKTLHKRRLMGKVRLSVYVLQPCVYELFGRYRSFVILPFQNNIATTLAAENLNIKLVAHKLFRDRLSSNIWPHFGYNSNLNSFQLCLNLNPTARCTTLVSRMLPIQIPRPMRTSSTGSTCLPMEMPSILGKG